MSVRKSLARLLGSDGSLIGEGRAYVHLRRAETEAQPVQGTLAMEWWDESGHAARLALENGPTLELQLQSDKLSECIQSRVLRYTARWPGAQDQA